MLNRMADSGGFGQVKVRNMGEYIGKNFRFSAIPSSISRLATSYRAKYVTCKNARMTPFFHMVGACMLLNYMIDYKYHLKYEKMRKYQ